jgi:hypothetical protein
MASPETVVAHPSRVRSSVVSDTPSPVQRLIDKNQPMASQARNRSGIVGAIMLVAPTSTGTYFVPVVEVGDLAAAIRPAIGMRSRGNGCVTHRQWTDQFGEAAATAAD